METDLENICEYHSVSRNILERNMRGDQEAVRRYNEIGCYECDGRDIGCRVYSNTAKANQERDLNTGAYEE